MSHPAFTCLRRVHIPTLNVELQEYRHLVTGARHLHLAADDTNNVFAVSVPTVPQDSTGVAHILEHTTLCGSKHYPVRDPFFMMTRRSLNTFMNAFTSSDWTAYPFASQNVKDFENLLHVYLDAVFFPILDPLDFAQEGHRLEFATPNDPSQALVRKGVVFNEMKGALSSTTQMLWQTISAALFPTTTYHHISGGHPREIPNLTHAQLKEFHALHYHPSNAVFMTYGDRPAETHQAIFQADVLQHFQALSVDLSVPDVERYTTPQRITEYYPVDNDSTDLSQKTHIVVGWLWGKLTDIDAVLSAHLLAGVLLDNSASPLRRALESTDLALSTSGLCGYDDNSRETDFICGVEGSDPEHADAIEALILNVLEDVATNGVPQEQVDAVLHQIELHQREISGSHFPYGLRLLLNALPPMLHGGDALECIDIDAALNTLRERSRDPEFLKRLTRELFLDNPHRVTLIFAPDPKLGEQRRAEELAELAAIKARLSLSEINQIVEQSEALKVRQQQQGDPELLPKVGLEDVPDTLHIAEGESRPLTNALPVTWFAEGTNGMVYQSIAIELPEFPPELLDLVPIFCDCVTELGCGERDYLETAALQSLVTGGISARVNARTSVNDPQQLNSFVILSGKALARNQAALTQLLHDTLVLARFDELSRIRELIEQYRSDNDNSINERGLSLAGLACNQGVSPAGALLERWNGIYGIRVLKELDETLDDEAALIKFAKQLEQIRDTLLQVVPQLVVVSEAQQHVNIAASLQETWKAWQLPAAPAKKLRPIPVRAQTRQIWSIPSEVNSCARTYPTITSEHPDAVALVVLGDFLRNGYLHHVVREKGGAYGSTAQYNGDVGSFGISSNRDPHVTETLTAFDDALHWLQTTQHEPRALEEAILGVICRMDRPSSPAGEALGSFFNGLNGRTPEYLRNFRQRILRVKIEDLQRVALTYLQPENANTVVFCAQQTLATLPDLGLEKCVLP